MSNLSLEEFNKLPENEKGDRYKELSDHDKFLVRISTPLNGGEVVGHVNSTKQEQIESAKQLLNIMVETKVISEEEAEKMLAEDIKRIENEK